MTMKLILASSSPRRAELLRGAGMAFAVCAPRVEEARRPGESVETMVARLAEAKARAAAELVGKNNSAIIIGADTAVELDGELFGKPLDAAHARKILAELSGRTHHVLTGICALRLPDGATRSAVETTAVTFAPLDANEIKAYVASGEPFDKAGGYAIQGRAGRYIPRIEGCYSNVVGLPLARLYTLLRDLGWPDDRQA
jgi:nucleoside triphosphate pyrophosphatase